MQETNLTIRISYNKILKEAILGLIIYSYSQLINSYSHSQNLKNFNVNSEEKSKDTITYINP